MGKTVIRSVISELHNAFVVTFRRLDFARSLPGGLRFCWSQALKSDEFAVPSLPASESSAGVPSSLYALFFLSGIGGLIFQTVWVRMLTRVLGSTAYATSTVLAAFMAGLALGSYLAGRGVDRVRRPLRWYAALEVGVGLAALASLALPTRLTPIYQAVYEWTNGARGWLTVGQVVVALMVLLLPTALMGATLPTLCAYGARRAGGFARHAATLYAINTLGAVAGVLISGFFLIGAVGETSTLLCGAAVNLVGAVGALLIERSNGTGAIAAAAPTDDDSTGFASPAIRRLVALSFAVAGFTALANEVVWGRMLMLYQGTAIYAFSAMLAVVLTGMGLGSLYGSRRADAWSDPLRVFARVQLCIGVAGALGLVLYDKMPLLPRPRLLAPLILLGPVTFFWGLAFPAAVRSYSPLRTATGRSVGTLYSWNTVGCILGALAAGFLLIPTLGAGRTSGLLAGASLLVGIVLLAKHPRGLRSIGSAEWGLAVAGVVLVSIAGDPYFRVVQNRVETLSPGYRVVYEHIEDASAATTAFGRLDGERSSKGLWVNGVGMTELTPETKLMAHLPLALADKPRDMLVICFGMGTTVRSAARHAGLDVTAVELVPGVLKCFPHFHADAREVAKRPNVHLTADDGRNYLLMHSKQYDVITLDPPPPIYSAGAVNLYTREFFELCRDRLRPGGVMCLWIPPDHDTEVRMIVRTYFDVFEHVHAWGPTGIYLIGSRQPKAGAGERVLAGLRDPIVWNDMTEWPNAWLQRPEQIAEHDLGEKRRLQPLFADAAQVTDDTPYTEFYLWRRLLNRNRSHLILDGDRLKEQLRGAPDRPRE